MVAVMAFMAGAFFVWALMSQHATAIPISRGEWPAWVQAFTSFIAILIAMFVPTKIAWDERRRLSKENHYKAMSLAFVLRPAIGSLISRVDSARRRWQLCPNQYDDSGVVAPLVIPDAINEHLLELHVLGESGVAVRRSINAIHALRAEIFTDYANQFHGGVYIDPDDGETIDLPVNTDVEGQIIRTTQVLREAMKSLNELVAD
ncbi:hypothetical protein ACQ5SA_00375 [Stenotrophomonas indicatrix]